MRRYLQAYFRHPILLSAPLVIALFVSIFYGLHQPRKYQAGASIWCDVPVPGDSTIFTGTSQPPSAAQAAVLTELLQTHEFLMSIGKLGPWADYLASHDQATDDRLVQQLGGTVTLYSNTKANVCPTPTSGNISVCIAPAETGAGDPTDTDCAAAKTRLGHDPRPGDLGSRNAEWTQPHFKGCFLVQVTVVYHFRPFTPYGPSPTLIASTSMLGEEF